MSISKRNKRGIAYLIILVVAIAFTPRIVDNLQAKDSPEISFTEAKKIEKKLKTANKIWSKQSKKKFYEKFNSKKYHSPASRFDPNQYSESDWLKLGLSEKQVEVIMKFTSRGVRSNEDLKKIYVLPEEVFLLIEDSTYYPKGEMYKRERDAFTEKDKNELYVPLNTATREQLEEIPGIGPYFSKKIIEHRESLGGYIQKEQLLDIWKIDPEKYQSIRNYIKLDQVETRKININSASLDELKAHPYIDYKVANSIVKMREQRGGFSSLDEIKESVLIELPLYRKIEPYLTVE